MPVGPEGGAGGTNSSLSGSPQHSSISPLVDHWSSVAQTCAGVVAGAAWSRRAAAPATCGADIDVPEIVFAAASEPSHADVISTPGAKMSLQGPKLEKVASWSRRSEAATVMADGVLAGLVAHVFWASLPAAITTVTPSATSASTHEFRVGLNGPPTLMLATAGTPAT